MPTQKVAAKKLAYAVGAGNNYWLDKQGVMFGPHEILGDWKKAKTNPLWADHIQTIERADLTKPIFVYSKNDAVFDGVHRLTRAFLDKSPEILVKVFDKLLESAVVND